MYIVVLRRTLAVLAGALVAAGAITAPASADPTFASLSCSTVDGSNRDVVVDVGVAGLGDAETVPARFRVSTATGLRYDVTHDLGATNHLVLEDVLPAVPGTVTYGVSIDIGANNLVCLEEWVGAVQTSSLTPEIVTAGKATTVTATFDTAAERGVITAILERYSGGVWKQVATSAIAADGSVNFNVTLSQTQTVRIVLQDPTEWWTYTSPSSTLNVFVPTPTISSKPTSIVHGSSRTVSVLYGGPTTTATAKFQYKNSSGYWVTLKQATLTGGKVSFTFLATATHTYRVAVTPPGKASLYTSAFTVTYKPLLSVKAPSSVKAGSTVTFTLTQYLAPPFYAYLQKYSGGKWVSVKSFVVGNTTEKVTAKVSSTSKWRISAAGRVSSSITVKAY